MHNILKVTLALSFTALSVGCSHSSNNKTADHQRSLSSVDDQESLEEFYLLCKAKEKGQKFKAIISPIDRRTERGNLIVTTSRDGTFGHFIGYEDDFCGQEDSFSASYIVEQKSRNKGINLIWKFYETASKNSVVLASFNFKSKLKENQKIEGTISYDKFKAKPRSKRRKRVKVKCIAHSNRQLRNYETDKSATAAKKRYGKFLKSCREDINTYLRKTYID